MDSITNTLISVDGNLKAMENSLKQYANGQGNKFNSWKSKTRAIVYGSTAACAAAGPFAFISCPIAYATAAGILETKIKDERNRVSKIQSQFR